MEQTILLVEDEQDLGHVVSGYLQLMEFQVDWHKTAEEAFQAFGAAPERYHILVIDVQLPGEDGFELAKKVSELSPATPFLFLTARNEKKDRLFGLRLGADDYINKPFDIDELVLRIRNIIRRNTPATITSGSIRAGDLTLQKDMLKLMVKDAGKDISLTPREAQLLEYLFLNKNKVVKREDILVKIWGENDYFAGRSLDVFISRLRKQLSASQEVKIENVYGVGFIFNVKEETTSV